MKRPGRIRTFMDIAFIISKRSTCARRLVGCVLVDIHNHVVATGYNGVASGMEHCIDNPCPGAEYESGKGLDKCQAIHAEANALLQCKDVYSIKDCFVTAEPCVHCTKLLMNTSCKNIYYTEYYPGESKFLWDMSRGKNNWIRFDPR
jgi:dCMP deaminase